MSSSLSPVEPPVRAQNSTPVPPPPVIDEDATVETSTTSEMSSETIPPQSAVRGKDYLYRASKIRERDERQPQRSRTPTPLSPGSTRMSDYGLLSSPQADARKMKGPVQAHQFETERGATPVREKMNRAWSLRKKKEVMRILFTILRSLQLLTGPRSLLHPLGITSVLHQFLLLPLQTI